MNIKEAWLSSGLISEVQAGKKMFSIYVSKTLCLLQFNCYFHLSLIIWYLLTLRQPFARVFGSKANLLRHLALPKRSLKLLVHGVLFLNVKAFKALFFLVLPCLSIYT